MERAISLFRTHPVSTGFTVAIVVALLIGALAAVLLTRAGLSVRPIIFFGGFLAIIVLPQWVYHILHERGLAPRLVWTPNSDSANRVEKESALEYRDGQFLFPQTVFGQGFDPSLLSDVRRLFESLAPGVAQMAVFPAVETTIAARFSDASQAQQAIRYYAAISGLGKLTRPNADGTYTVARASDVARLGVVGRTLFVWTGANANALDRRQSASSGAWTSAAPAAADPRVAQWLRGMMIALPVLVAIASLWFFKMSSWAASIPPVPQPWPAAASELRSRLLALPSTDKHVVVTPGEKPDEVVVTWSDDATWADPANVHRQSRGYKIVLHLDERSKTARVTEFSRRSDASAGASGLRANWRAERGIVFFQVDYQKVVGLQLRSDPSTATDPKLSHTVRFSLQQLKAPLISSVVKSGWTWKPVLWNGPAWARWATE